MKNAKKLWKKQALTAAVLGMLAIGGVPVAAEAAQVAEETATATTASLTAPIEQVTGIAKTYGDGEFVEWAVVRYDVAMDPSSVEPGDFAVDGQTIDEVRVGETADVPEKSRAGRYVFLKLHHENTAKDGALGGGSKREAAGSDAAVPAAANGQAAAMPRHDGPEPGAGIMRADRTVPDLSFAVRQVGRLYAADGTPVLPQAADAAAVASASVTNPVLASFTQHTYDDAAVGASMPYNLFLPAGYDGTKRYPLLIFIPDASANINEVTTPLFQGNGATVFADPVWQAKHPCIVLALQYTDDLVTQLGMMTTDANGWSSGLQLAWDTIEHVTQSCAVDTRRIYGTGQSQGGMANIAIADRHPDFFAAQYLVACQWNTEEMAALKDSHLWITVSTGDTKAHPGMDAATALWEKLGTRVSKNAAPWNNKVPISVLDAAVRAQAKEGAPINYTVFAGGNHMYTWSFAYNIDAIREWLFAQKKA